MSAHVTPCTLLSTKTDRHCDIISPAAPYHRPHCTTPTPRLARHAYILTSDTRDFLKLFLWLAERENRPARRHPRDDPSATYGKLLACHAESFGVIPACTRQMWHSRLHHSQLKPVVDSASPSVRENVCNNSKQRKSHVLGLKKRKNAKKRTYSFTGHSIA